MIMTDIRIVPNGLRLIIEQRQDSLGKVCYQVTTFAFKIRFRTFSAVNEFIEMNQDLGSFK